MRWLLVAIASALLGVFLASIPDIASGHNKWRQDGVWLHQNTRQFDYCIKGGTFGQRRDIRAAAEEWDRKTIANLRKVRCSRANVFVRVADWGATSWSGNTHVFWQDNGIVIPPARVKINSFYSLTRPISCHEFGHVLGLWHRAGDCLAPVAVESHVGLHNQRMINRIYRSIS